MGWNGAVLAGGARNSRTAEEVFDDIKGRRNGLITALTNDFESFYSQCDPAKENLCLYGYPDGNWEVKLPGGELPEELPEPILGINSARDSTPKNVWWRLVALHCDAWLLSMAFYFGARYGFDKSDRNRLFDMINGLPTIFEIVHEAVIEADKEQVKHKSSGETKKRKHSEIIGWDGATLAGGARDSLTVEEVFNDFKGRHVALITALTDDFELFYMQCDPEKENLCLYGYPDGKWEVKSPSEEAPQYLPEPILGINFARVGMEKKDWQCLVAAYSDAWLLSVVFHLGAINGFDKSDRNRLFDMINDLPVILEIAREADKDQVKDDSSGNLGVDK